MSRLLIAVSACALVACTAAREACDDGHVFDGATCMPYTPGDPVEADVWRPAEGTTWQWQITEEVDVVHLHLP